MAVGLLLPSLLAKCLRSESWYAEGRPPEEEEAAGTLRDWLPCRRRVYSGLMQGREPQIIPMQISRLEFVENTFSIMRISALFVAGLGAYGAQRQSCARLIVLSVVVLSKSAGSNAVLTIAHAHVLVWNG